MSFSLLNWLFLANIGVGTILDFRKIKQVNFAPYAGIASMLVLSAALFVETALGSSIWPLVVVSIFYCANEACSYKKGTQAHYSLIVFFTFWPLILLLADSVLSFSLFLIVGEVFKHFWMWKRMKTPASLIRVQFLDTFKVITLFLVLAFSFTSLNSFDFKEISRIQEHSVLFLVGLLGLLAFLYMGVFESSKDEMRARGFLSQNGAFVELVYRFLAPGIIIVKANIIMVELEYTFHLQELKYLLILLLGGVVSCFAKAYQSGHSSLYQFKKLYVFLLFSLHLFIEDFGAFQLLSSLTVVGGLFLILETFPGNQLGKDLRKISSYFILPTPFSPFLWLLVLQALGYKGVLRPWLVLFAVLVAISGFLMFNRQRTRLFPNSNLPKEPITFVNLLIMITFVSILFVAKIYT